MNDLYINSVLQLFMKAEIKLILTNANSYNCIINTNYILGSFHSIPYVVEGKFRDTYLVSQFHRYLTFTSGYVLRM